MGTWVPTHIVSGTVNWYIFGNHCGITETKQNLETELLYDLALPSMCMSPEDPVSYYEDRASTMFIAALLIIARKWNQHRFISTDKLSMKMWYVYTRHFIQL